MLLEEFLGLDVVHTTNERARATTITGDDGACIEIADGLFGCPAEDWLTERSLPLDPVAVWDPASSGLGTELIGPDLPLLWSDGPLIVLGHRTARTGVDIFGSSFFMLTRYEEAVVEARDAHGRFPAERATAVRNGFLSRPIVDEYTEVLWALLARMWPRLQRRSRQFQVFSTHDVDHPFAYSHVRPRQVARSVGGLLKQGRAAAGWKIGSQWLAVKVRGTAHDPWNTFDQAMDVCDAQGVRCGFYFIPDPDPVGREAGYEYRLDDAPIVQLLRHIHGRGHEIGFHASYGSHLQAVRIRDEFDRLRNTCAGLGIDQAQWGGRAHFLRWDTPGSAAAWDAAGLDYDSTLGYAEAPGFRCGVCRTFPMFDLSTRRQLHLRERPLVVMDATISESAYLGLQPGGTEAHETVAALREQCRKFDGEFVVLWHHNVLAQHDHFDLWTAAVAGATER